LFRFRYSAAVLQFEDLRAGVLIGRALLINRTHELLFIAVKPLCPHALADIHYASLALLQLRFEIVAEFQTVAPGNRDCARAIHVHRTKPFGSQLLLGQLLVNEISCCLMDRLQAGYGNRGHGDHDKEDHCKGSDEPGTYR
jgi:hypothetical protein